MSFWAMLHSQPHLANRIVVVRFSQGAGAAFATGGFAPAYSPDLGIRGIITTGIPNWMPDVLEAPPPEAEVIARISERPIQQWPTTCISAWWPSSVTRCQQTVWYLPAVCRYLIWRAQCVGVMFYNLAMAGLNRANALVPSYRDSLARLLSRHGVSNAEANHARLCRDWWTGPRRSALMAAWLGQECLRFRHGGRDAPDLPRRC